MLQPLNRPRPWGPNEPKLVCKNVRFEGWSFPPLKVSDIRSDYWGHLGVETYPVQMTAFRGRRRFNRAELGLNGRADPEACPCPCDPTVGTYGRDLR